MTSSFWLVSSITAKIFEGCKENTDPFVEHPSPWSAFRSSNYGFSRMHIFNATHLYFEQIAASKVSK